MLKIVPDAGAIAGGHIERMLVSGELAGAGIILPSAVIDQLYGQADSGDSGALRALDAISGMHSAAAEARASVRVYGEKIVRRPDPDNERRTVGTAVRNVALDNGATIYTTDNMQAAAARAAGIPVVMCAKEGKGEPWFVEYFDETTMSVHLKEGLTPMAKRGSPGDVSLVAINSELLSRKSMEEWLATLEDMTRSGHAADISYPGALVLQYKSYRIVATHKPFSEAHEITIVHPVVSLSLDDYDMPDMLKERLVKGAEGILVSGAPGSGKSTLASALANHYHKMSKTVKTLESPRDLQLEDGITQYSKLDEKFANSADILLLVRPDYTVFDEVRRREDFEVFSDLRLSGVGMIGVVHANSPLDAIQRFIGKIELGIIPHVLDTVVFVDGGKVESVYSLSMLVKVPSGMVEQDLARPVIEIRDFETGQLIYEVYAFGEENMIVPVTEQSKETTGVDYLAAERVREIMKRFDHSPLVEIVTPGSIKVGISKDNIASVIGRGGSNIGALERELRVHINVVDRSEMKGTTTKNHDDDSEAEGVEFEMIESKAFLVLEVDRKHSGSRADILSGSEVIVTSRVDRKGRIRLPRHTSGAREIAQAYSEGDISVVIKRR